MATLGHAQRDEHGRVYVEASTTAPGTGGGDRFDYSGLRCYACPIADAAKVQRSSLLPIFRTLEAGGSVKDLGVATLTEGAVSACAYLAKTNADLSLQLSHIRQQQAKADAARGV